LPDQEQHAANGCLPQPALSKVLFEVHPLMQDAHDIDTSFDKAIKNEMRACRVLAIAGADIIACASATGIFAHNLYGAPNLLDIDFGLFDSPNAGAVIPNFSMSCWASGLRT
jgi:hypothetical protein